jgi:hypothetical protein
MTGRIRLADVQPEQVTWFWPNHIPAGDPVTPQWFFNGGWIRAARKRAMLG